MFGSDEQKERFLPDLAAGRKLAGFALTEPEAGSDAYELKSRAVAQPDGSWVLNGEKRYIGNGSQGRRLHRLRPLRGRRQGPPHRADPREGDEGLRGRRALRHHGPARQRPAAPATSTTSGCRPRTCSASPATASGSRCRSSTTAASGSAPARSARPSSLIDLAIDHVKERRQFGQPARRLRARPGQDRLDGLLPVRARVDVLPDLRARRPGSRTTRSSRRSARSPGPSSSGTRRTGRCSSRGGAGYMRDEPYEKILRDIRIFPIFEGANDVMRAFIALSGMKPVGEKLSGLGEIGLGDPIGSIGVLADYVGGRIRARCAPSGSRRPTLSSPTTPTPSATRCKELHARAESLLREHKRGDRRRASSSRSGSRAAISDIYAQVAVLSRVTSIFEDQGVEPSGQERYIADTFCARAADRVRGELPPDRDERRRAQSRDREARLQARRVRLRAVRGLMPRRPGLAVPPLLLACAALVAGCGGGSDDTSAAAATSSTSTTTTSTSTTEVASADDVYNACVAAIQASPAESVGRAGCEQARTAFAQCMKQLEARGTDPRDAAIAACQQTAPPRPPRCDRAVRLAGPQPGRGVGEPKRHQGGAMIARFRSRLTFANVCSLLALLIALGTGSAYAANTVFSTDIVDGEVKTADIANNAVTLDQDRHRPGRSTRTSAPTRSTGRRSSTPRSAPQTSGSSPSTPARSRPTPSTGRRSPRTRSTPTRSSTTR